MWCPSACCDLRGAAHAALGAALLALASTVGAAPDGSTGLTGSTGSTRPTGSTAPIILDQPIGGWRDSRLLNEVQQEAVAYPYNLIDRGAQRGRTLIRGRLQVAATDRHRRRAPATLVVNGNSMPLYTGPDGQYARPYAFAPGSNSVEVIEGDAGSDAARRRRVQFYETHGDGARAAMRVIVSWDDPQAEVDLHVLSPDGQHAYWAQPVMQGGGGFDVDSVDGAGPEMFSVAAPRPGVWHFYVNYWGRFSEDGYHFDDQARRAPVVKVRLSIVTGENTPAERRATRLVPLRRIGDLTWIDALNW